MDNLGNYKGFDTDIKDVFEPIIKKYDFIYVEIFPGRYELNNGKCSLRFAFDRGDIFCTIRRPDDSPNETGISALLVYRYLYPESQEFNGRLYNFKPQLQQNEQILTKLGNVLEGDFSWLEGCIRKFGLKSSDWN